MGEIRLPTLNRVLITGRLTADPNLSYTPDGIPILKFRIASSNYYKDQSGNWKETVAYLPVSIWRQQAERLSDTLHKGSAVLVEGKLQSSSWESNGQKRSKVEISAFRAQNLDKVKFTGKEAAEENVEGAPQETGEKPPDDDLPF